jgi:mannose-6-phosphate isomerase-like protein (cupin superfamily)
MSDVSVRPAATAFAPTPGGVIAADAGRPMRVVGDAITLKAIGTGSAWSLFSAEAPEKVGPPRHRHPWDETYYITSGILEVLVGDTWAHARPGDTIVVPAGVQHTFHGLDGKAEFLIFVAPAGVEAMFDDFDRNAPEVPPVMEKVMDIATRHKVEVLGPPGR